MNTKVEAQGGELVLRNTHGDVVIIPRNKRREALGYLAKGDHSAIDAIAMELPKASDYAMGGAVYDGGEDPIEGVMGPETTIVGKRPFSVKNFLNRWGKHHAENPSDNFFGALGQGLMALLQLAQAGATYALTDGKEIEPGTALRGSKFTNFMNKLSNSPTMDPISKAAASALGSETGQNILFDPLNIPMKRLTALNQIQNLNLILTGDLLRIPIKGVMGPGVTIVGSKTTKTSDALPINIPPVPRDNTYVNTPIIYTDPNSLTNPKTNPKTNAVIGQMNFNTTPIRGFTATDKSSRYAGPVVRNPAPKPVPNRQTPKNLKPRTSITPISADNTRTNIPIIYNDSLRIGMSKALDKLYNPQNYVTKRK